MSTAYAEPARALCEGDWDLFDATDMGSHELAASICRACPLMKDCAVSVSAIESPVGTWAARLHGGSSRPSIDPVAEDGMFTEDEAREAHNAWNRGERTELNKIGRRVYMRRLRESTAEREALRGEDGTLPSRTEERYAEEDAMFTDDEARRGATTYRGGDKSEHNALAQRVHKRRQRQARRPKEVA
jgi:hypothetical protein